MVTSPNEISPDHIARIAAISSKPGKKELMPKAHRPTTARAASDPDAKTASRLADYEAKRRFDVTPEPRAESFHSPAPKGKKLAFVVQKHGARRLHYDVRLEIDGTMMSWAVPKEPSNDPSVKRLAVQTEDHPLSYASFEGRIPDGEYGAGDMAIWDHGHYETVPPGEELAMRNDEHFHIRFSGEKLKGDWHIIRTKRGDNQWLMFRATASFSNARELVLSMGEAARATNASGPTDLTNFSFEIKYDGYRLIAGKAASDVKLFSRAHNDWSDRFKPIVAAIKKLTAREAVLDGEACVIDAHGAPGFARLQQWLAGERVEGTLAFCVFDLLWLDGRDLRRLPLEERRDLLQALLRDAPPPLSFSASIEGDLAEILQVTRAAGLEGLVAKRKGSTYDEGPTTSWLKIKFQERQDCAVVGYTPMSGTNVVGALVLAVVEPDGRFVYAGRVGTGFDTKTRRDLARRLDLLRVKTPAATGAPRLSSVVWTKPDLVADVGHVGWTRSGSPFHPRFLGLREDKLPMECMREMREGVPDIEAPKPDVARPPVAVKLTNPDKLIFPNDGFNKRDILAYYMDIAPFMLPHLAGRPLTLQRWPNGIHGKEWYQHRVPPDPPEFVRLMRFEDSGRSERGEKQRIIVDNIETLGWLANLAALTIHGWTSHALPNVRTETEVEVEKALSLPDYVVIDLDPGNGPWADVIEVAMSVRVLLEALELESVVKTSGKRGIHVIIPIARGPSHAQATAFAASIAQAVAKVHP
ncbi:MAG: DNA ligase D, partial [Polyangiaceae bacterium]